MPKKRGYRRRRHRRSRRKNRPNQSSLVFRGRNFMPQRFLTKHIYSNSERLDTTSSQQVTRQFSINGLFNVDPSGVAVQPFGFDQIGLIYDKFQVYACTLETMAVNAGADACVHIIFPYNGIDSSWTAVQALQMPYSSKVILSSKGGGKDVRNMKKFVKPAYLVGRNQYKSSYEGTVLSNPIEEMRWNIHYINAEGNTDLHVNTTFKLTYYVKWFNFTEVEPS